MNGSVHSIEQAQQTLTSVTAPKLSASLYRCTSILTKSGEGGGVCIEKFSMLDSGQTVFFFHLRSFIRIKTFRTRVHLVIIYQLTKCGHKAFRGSEDT